MRLFRTSGAMTDTLLAMLTVESVEEIRAAQDANHIIRAGAGGQQLSQEVVLTMVGIKILREFFAEDQKLWNLVEKKALKFAVKSAPGIDRDSLSAAIDSLNTMFKIQRSQ